MTMEMEDVREEVELIDIPNTVECEKCLEDTDPRDMVGPVCWECADN